MKQHKTRKNAHKQQTETPLFCMIAPNEEDLFSRREDTVNTSRS